MAVVCSLREGRSWRMLPSSFFGAPLVPRGRPRWRSAMTPTWKPLAALLLLGTAADAQNLRTLQGPRRRGTCSKYRLLSFRANSSSAFMPTPSPPCGRPTSSTSASPASPPSTRSDSDSASSSFGRSSPVQMRSMPLSAAFPISPATTSSPAPPFLCRDAGWAGRTRSQAPSRGGEQPNARSTGRIRVRMTATTGTCGLTRSKHAQR